MRPLDSQSARLGVRVSDQEVPCLALPLSAGEEVLDFQPHHAPGSLVRVRLLRHVTTGGHIPFVKGE